MYEKTKKFSHLSKSERNEILILKLLKGESPQNVSDRLKRLKKNKISKDSICRYIKSVYGRKIETWRKKQKQGRKTRRLQEEKLKDRILLIKDPYISIPERELRISWKGRSRILVVADRKSRVPFLEKIFSISVSKVEQAFHGRKV